jgi:hypothetical protein
MPFKKARFYIKKSKKDIYNKKKNLLLLFIITFSKKIIKI